MIPTEFPSSKVNFIYASGANVAQLVCLSNLENFNALFIEEGLSQPQRLKEFNQIAINQMRLLTEDSAVKLLDKGHEDI